MMSTGKGFRYAPRAWRALSGMFAVYKPAGMSPNRVRHIIRTSLLEELNALEQRPQKTLVKIEAEGGTGLSPTEPGALRAVEVPSFADHPLVRGPAFRGIPLAVVSTGLDSRASGVLVLSVRQGNQLVNQYQSARLPRQYTVRGCFGVATDTHDGEGKVWQKTTYDHITLEKLDRITARIQLSYQREMIRHCGVDIQSQEAYELAARGLLGPMGRANPLVTDIKCTAFDPPHFELEIISYAETAQYLRKLVHDVGQELKSSAVALQVRRTGDGPFTTEHALLRKHWKLDRIAAAIEQCRPLVVPADLVPVGRGREAARATVGAGQSRRRGVGDGG